MELKEFEKTYKPILKNPNGATWFDKYIWETKEDVREMNKLQLNKVWSLLDLALPGLDDFDFIIKPGFYSGNFPKMSQLGWVVTENSWTNNQLTVQI